MILSSSDIYSAVVHYYDDDKKIHGYIPTNRLLFLGVPGYDLRVIFFRSSWETHPEYNQIDLSEFDGKDTKCDDYDVRTINEFGIRKAIVSAYPNVFESVNSILFNLTDNGLTAESNSMHSLEQLNYLIKHYSMGEYTAWDFTSLFTEIYYIKPDDSLTEEYKEYFLPLAQCCERFSPYKEDLELPDSPFKNKDELDRIVREYFSED